MAKIPRNSIKQLVKSHFNASITEEGADALARMLEQEAERISRFAVENARKEKRSRVTKKDISMYIVNKD